MNTLEDFIEHFVVSDDANLELEKIHKRESLSPKVRQFQLIHKLKRILGEIEFVKNNEHKFYLLTGREKEIIKILASGLNNAEIAQKLFISRRTVEQHRKNINRKLEISCFVELNSFAYAFNLV